MDYPIRSFCVGVNPREDKMKNLNLKTVLLVLSIFLAMFLFNSKAYASTYKIDKVNNVAASSDPASPTYINDLSSNFVITGTAKCDGDPMQPPCVGTSFMPWSYSIGLFPYDLSADIISAGGSALAAKAVSGLDAGSNNRLPNSYGYTLLPSVENDRLHIGPDPGIADGRYLILLIGQEQDYCAGTTAEPLLNYKFSPPVYVVVNQENSLPYFIGKDNKPNPLEDKSGLKGSLLEFKVRAMDSDPVDDPVHGDWGKMAITVENLPSGATFVKEDSSEADRASNIVTYKFSWQIPTDADDFYSPVFVLKDDIHEIKNQLIIPTALQLVKETRGSPAMNAQIITPADGEYLHITPERVFVPEHNSYEYRVHITLNGNASCQNFGKYKIYWTNEGNSDGRYFWQIKDSASSVTNGVLYDGYLPFVDGKYLFNLRVFDKDGDLKNSSCTRVILDNDNNPPVFRESYKNLVLPAGSSVNFPIKALDPDDPNTPEGTLNYSATGLPDTANYADGYFSWNIPATERNGYQVTLTASDGVNSASKKMIIRVTDPVVPLELSDFSVVSYDLFMNNIIFNDASGKITKVEVNPQTNSIINQSTITESELLFSNPAFISDKQRLFYEKATRSPENPNIIVNKQLIDTGKTPSELDYRYKQNNFRIGNIHTRGQKVAWGDSGSLFSDVNSGYAALYGAADNIFYYDGAQVKQLTYFGTNHHDRQPRAYATDSLNDYVVYSGCRLAYNDIVGYDLVQKKEFSVCTALGGQVAPSIYKDKIVWEDSRESGLSIYMYSLNDRKEKLIACDLDSSDLNPDIYENKIVYVEGGRLWMEDLATGTRTLLMTGDYVNCASPLIYGDNIIFRNSGLYFIKYEPAPYIQYLVQPTTRINDTVLVSGLGFGSQQGDSVLNLGVKDSALEVLNWSDTIIRVKVKPEATTDNVKIVTPKKMSNNKLLTIATPVPQSPWITSILDEHGNPFPVFGCGNKFVIRGSAFGNETGKILYDGQDYGSSCNIASWSDTEIRVNYGSMVGTNNLGMHFDPVVSNAPGEHTLTVVKPNSAGQSNPGVFIYDPEMQCAAVAQAPAIQPIVMEVIAPAPAVELQPQVIEPVALEPVVVSQPIVTRVPEPVVTQAEISTIAVPQVSTAPALAPQTTPLALSEFVMPAPQAAAVSAPVVRAPAPAVSAPAPVITQPAFVPQPAVTPSTAQVTTAPVTAVEAAAVKTQIIYIPQGTTTTALPAAGIKPAETKQVLSTPVPVQAPAVPEVKPVPAPISQPEVKPIPKEELPSLSVPEEPQAQAPAQEASKINFIASHNKDGSFKDIVILNEKGDIVHDYKIKLSKSKNVVELNRDDKSKVKIFLDKDGATVSKLQITKGKTASESNIQEELKEIISMMGYKMK